MPRVATFVFTALETSSLDMFELNEIGIVELSMVAVRRRHILGIKPGATPRVQEKLTVCLNPSKIIDADISCLINLDNVDLEQQSTFNMNVFNTINCFLQSFEKPVCLVAFDGHLFDFIILRKHFDDLGVSLPDDILCADSLHAFYEILELGSQENISEAGPSGIDNDMEGDNTNESSSDRSHNHEPSDKIVDKGTNSDKPMCHDSDVHSEENITKEVVQDWLQDNERSDYLKGLRAIQGPNERTMGALNPKKTTSRGGSDLFGATTYKKRYISCHLSDIYEHFCKLPVPKPYGAETNCIMSMEVSVAKAKQFAEWIDNEANQCKFSEVNLNIRKIRNEVHTYRTIKNKRIILAYSL